ncbi:hypothetical protein UlMin_003322 [Ulmus minor]
MESFWRAANGQMVKPNNYEGMEFWLNPKRTGWLTKQGEYIKTWPLQGKPMSVSCDVVLVVTCLTVKGAEDTLYFIADSEKEKEDWVNSIRQSIVHHLRSVSDSEVVDYDNKK